MTRSEPIRQVAGGTGLGLAAADAARLAEVGLQISRPIIFWNGTDMVLS